MSQTIFAIIDEFKDKTVFDKLKINTIALSSSIFDDITIDEFLVEKIQTINPSILIIPASLGSIQTNYWGLRIGMHIRLSSFLEKIRLIPIIFISDNSLEEILRFQEEKFGIQAVLEGSLLVKNNLHEIQAAIEYLEPIDENRYISGFVEKVIIQRPPSIGKHSLANIWGALRLNEVLSLNAITDKSLIDRTKELYFKYLRAFHNEDKQTYIDLQPLKCQGKRILLIDDEADKGWASVLKVIFKNADFQYINFQNRSFEDVEQDAKERIKKEDWDLILLDLRLNPKLEDLPNQQLKTEDYSGAKLLKSIKEHNAGIQVIMLTASNKAWNMKKLLDLGADGYYIKESPEFNFSPSSTKESYDNFKNEVLKCFQLSFLRKIADIHKSCNSALNTTSPLHNQVRASLEIAFELLKKSAKNGKYFNLAYLTYYQILENYVGQRENFNFVSKTECYVNDEGQEHRVISSGTETGKVRWELDYQPTNGGYFKKTSVKVKEFSVESLAKISFVLAFKFKKDDKYLKKWGRLNNLRNTKAGHGGSNGFITIDEIKELLEIVEIFFN